MIKLIPDMYLLKNHSTSKSKATKNYIKKVKDFFMQDQNTLIGVGILGFLPGKS